MVIKMKDVSVDSETWGKRPGCDIRSIGAFLFDPLDTILQITDENTFYIACENPLTRLDSASSPTPLAFDFIDGLNRRYNLYRDPETVMWWHDQSEELQAAFDDPVELKSALLLFSEFLYSISEDIRDGVIHDVRVWSHGAGFDPPIIEAAYIACKLTYPLFYRSPRDTRTVYDDAGIEDHSAHLKKHNSGPLHHALYDSISQAKAIADAKQRIKTSGVEISNTAISCLEKIADSTVVNSSLTHIEMAAQALQEINLMKMHLR